MLTADTFRFLKELEQNNHKDWFEINRNRYVLAQNELKLFIADWIQQFGKIDTDIAFLEPNKCVFRINRDVRFSADKRPYKTNLGAYLTKGGKNTNFAGYYLHIQPGNCFFGAGIYMPQPEQLVKIRQEIDYNFSDFKKILSGTKFKSTFQDLRVENQLKRPPKGYDENNEAIHYLKLKSYTVAKPLSDAEIMDKNFIKTITQLSQTVHPLIRFLNEAVG